MSRDASVTLDFAGAEYTFRLGIAALQKVQEKCDAGPEELLKRYFNGDWRVQDVREVLRQGLISGGPMDVNKVDILLRAEFDDLPMLQFVKLAQAVVMAALVGAPDENDKDDDDTGEPEGEPAETPEASPAES